MEWNGIGVKCRNDLNFDFFSLKIISNKESRNNGEYHNQNWNQNQNQNDF
jgi:hypothetical protein